jgi:IS30 family transposase
MKTDKQLTQYQRYHFRIYLKAGYSQSIIDRLISVHKSIDSRAIQRNKDDRRYNPKKAYLKALKRLRVETIYQDATRTHLLD